MEGEEKMAEKKNELTFGGSLKRDLAEVKGALPKDFNSDRFVQNAVALLNGNTTLQEFAKKNGTAQIKANMMKAAYLGLDFMSSEAHLVPYGSTLNFMIDYRGAEKLVKKYSIKPVDSIYSFIVREGDSFEATIKDNEPCINFTPKPFNDGKVVGACAYIKFKDNTIQYDTMSLKELENTRNHSKAKNSPAWTSFTLEMYRKTILHRLCKHVTLDFENAQQIQTFNSDMEIETDVKKVAEADIQANANKESLEDADVVEVVVETDGQTSFVTEE